MVYVYSKLRDLNSYLKKELTSQKIKEVLIDMGMDLKAEKEVDGDIELKIEITAERFDLISTVGIARAINYYLGFIQNLKDFKVQKGTDKVIVNSNLKDVRPFTCAFKILDFKLDEKKLLEIIEIQEKIHESFGRNRKKAAIGIYPIQKIKFPIHFEARDKKDINFHPLFSDRILSFDEIISENEAGRKYKHLIENLNSYAVFRDSTDKILSLTPIINSFETGKVENHHKDLFVEVSGHNLELLDKVAKILATSFYEIGAKIETIDVVYDDRIYVLDLRPNFDEISLNYINKLIGFDIGLSEAKKLLLKSMYEVSEINQKADDTILKVKIPPFKLDVWSDCDIADDIARSYGYNNLIPKKLDMNSIGEKLEFTKFKNQIRQSLISQKFLELYTYLLSSKQKQFEMMRLDEKKFDFVSLKDTKEEGINLCRINVLPEILESLKINRKNSYPQKVFEIGMTIQKDKLIDTKSSNCEKLCSVIADTKSNYTQIKETFDLLNNIFNLNLEVKEKNFEFLIEGRSAKILKDGLEVGFIGEVNPKVLTNFNLLVPVCCFEIDLRKIFSD